MNKLSSLEEEVIGLAEMFAQERSSCNVKYRVVIQKTINDNSILIGVEGRKNDEVCYRGSLFFMGNPRKPLKPEGYYFNTDNEFLDFLKKYINFS